MTPSNHDTPTLQPGDNRKLGRRAAVWSTLSILLGVMALALAVFISVQGDDMKRFGFAYLTSFAYVLSLSMGCLLFVLLTHLFKAGWSIMVRRVAEVFAANIATLAILFLPILACFVLTNNGLLYPWAKPDSAFNGQHGGSHAAADWQVVQVASEQHGDTVHEEAGSAPHGAVTAGKYGDPAMAKERDIPYQVNWKRAWLNANAFTVRCVIYLLIWSGLGIWYWKQSTRQDVTGDPQATRRMETFSAPATLIVALTLTFGMFDILMSLDPTWYSTVFGVYYFAGCMIGSMSMLVLVLMGLQKAGLVPGVTIGHYHDLGKLMFAFVVFWAYIAYSQFMLIWYTTLPAEQPWPTIRGMSTAHATPYQTVVLILLFGHFLFPFLGFMSRHMKRHKLLLGFWAVWLLVVHWIDMFWLVMPEFGLADGGLPIGPIEIACLIGIAGVFMGVAGRIAAANRLVPCGDPRLSESVGFRTPW